MSEKAGQFRSAAFGGFHRQDVLDYLEKMSVERQEERAAQEAEKAALLASLEEERAARARAENRLTLLENREAETSDAQKGLEEELARLQGISPSYLSTLFKKETGKTLTDYVQQRRVGYARQLLASTKLQVQTIAQYCGIPDVNYFSKTFKKYAGMTPMEYRAQEQGRTP